VAEDGSCSNTKEDVGDFAGATSEMTTDTTIQDIFNRIINGAGQQRKQYDFKIEGAKVFATCNEISRLSEPLQSRFRCLHLPRYTEQQFLQVSVKVLRKLKIAPIIGKAVWEQRGDIRDVISIGKLVRKNDCPEEVEQILSTMTKYGRNNDGNSTSGAGLEY
jgi:hypothetical protein